MSKEVVSQTEYSRELWRLTNLEMFIGTSALRAYANSVDVQLELPYPDLIERLGYE
jgi:hypothetical protein